MKRTHFPLVLLLLLSLFSTPPSVSGSESKFISGLLVIGIRDGIEKPNKTIGTVKTGDKVEVLEESNRFSRIRTSDNIEGWIPSQFLQGESPKIENISKLKEEIAALKLKNEQLSQQAGNPNEKRPGGEQMNELIAAIDTLKAENKRLLEENRRLLTSSQDHERIAQSSTADKEETRLLQEKLTSLQSRFDALSNSSKDIINITKERDNLASEIEPLRAELAKSKERGRSPENDQMLTWFFAGAAVFFIGLLSSKFFTRKKSKLSF